MARRREARAGFFFVAPSVIGFLVFVLGPVVAAAVISFTKYDILTAPQFIGFGNYTRMFSDERLIKSYANTLIYVVAAVILINAIGLVLAVLVNQRLPGVIRQILRSVFFFPSLVALVYVSVIWQAMFQKDTGIINYYLVQVGGSRVDWLNSANGSVLSVIIVDTWRNVGFAMLIFLAALQEVPKDLMEAADIDGARPWTKFRRITLPLISPAVFFNITITVIGAFQIYEAIIVLTGGGPGDSSRSIVMYIAEQAFQKYNMGYASAIAMTLFAIILGVTLLQFRVRRRWVHSE